MPRRVAIFVTCIVDQLFPNAGMAMVNVLERLGFEVEFRAGQTCCGQPAFNSGYHKEARAVARHFIDTFNSAETIVVPSGSCTSMITHHYTELFSHDPMALARIHGIVPKVFEFSQFLLDLPNLEKLEARFPHKVTYHDSCHALRELGLKDAPRRLLGLVKDLELVEMSIPEECCGFGGTFSIKFPEVSGAMARTKVDSILETGASHVVSLDSSCLMQLRGALSRGGHKVETMHLAEVLASRA
jgi:L-lactate dehydrogenase complex protein LldE